MWGQEKSLIIIRRKMAKTSLPKTEQDVYIAFANWLQQVILMLQPKNAVAILGRATGKTTGILAPRIQDISEDMPGCYIAITSDTYMNARRNILPSITDGWKNNQWMEGIHFVVNKQPPKHFGKPYKSPIEWLHSLTDFFGTHYKLISQDRPSVGAGDSYQHIIGDEAKYLNKQKLSKLIPAKRGGELKYKDSPYYGGVTYTTDMPNINHGEYDWILEFESQVDKKQIYLMMLAAFKINKIQIELYHAKKANDVKEVRNIQKKYDRWEKDFRQLRKNSTFFYIASSFVNVDYLGYEYFKEQLAELLFSDVASSILSIAQKLEKGKQFYPNLSKSHFYGDGWSYNRVDRLDWAEELEESSVDLKYIDPKQAIEGGLDTGNMCSLVTGQDLGSVNRIFKNFYTLPPEFLSHLAKKFRDFYNFHQEKHLVLYHDRGANAYKKVGEDHASKFKKAVEFDEKGMSTGWTVTLMNEEQATISQEQEYNLALELMEARNKELPKLLIDKNNCKELKSSLEKAEKIERINKHGQKTIHKNKSSEKLSSERLAMESTNMSDAFKYYICRPHYLEKIAGNKILFRGLPGAR